MEQTATAAPQPEPQARDAAPPPAPPTDLGALRLVERRWPRAVPEKRVFPRS